MRHIRGVAHKYPHVFYTRDMPLIMDALPSVFLFTQVQNILAAMHVHLFYCDIDGIL